jgi:hypothetical protein
MNAKERKDKTNTEKTDNMKMKLRHCEDDVKIIQR